MAARRRFGRVRKLASGRWQARYLGPDGIDRPASHTFETKRDAEIWLSVQETELVRGQWLDPDGGRTIFGLYATAWVDERPNLRPKTISLYRYLLRAHLAPSFADLPLADIKEARIRQWRRERLEAGVGEVTLAKAYRLMRAVLNTAVDDGLIARNPARVKGAGQEHSPERPTLGVGVVYALADEIEPRYRVLVLTATVCALRWSELAALRRRDLDLVGATVTVVRSKTEAGRRTVVIPEVLLPELRTHLTTYSQRGSDGLVFTGPTGAGLQHSNFRGRVWVPALGRLGLTDVHFHDLRHTGNMLAAEAGASLRELMDRLGHSSTRAALIYLHSTAQRQRRIAADMSDLISLQRAAVDRDAPLVTGTQRARRDDEVS